MNRWTLHETKGDIRYEVEGNMLILKIRPEFISNIPVGQILDVIKTDDTTIPSDNNVFSASRVIKEIADIKSSGKPTALYKENLTEKYLYADESKESAYLVYSLMCSGDVVAYADSSVSSDIPLTSVNQFGLCKPDGTTITSVGGVLTAIGGGQGSSNVTWEKSEHDNYEKLLVDQNSGRDVALFGHLHDDRYIRLGYVKWSDGEDGYGVLTIDEIPHDVSIKGHKHLVEDITNIDGKFVTIDTDQTITGQKTFTKDILGKKDVVAYSDGSTLDGIPVASTSQYGLVMYDGITINVNAYGQLQVIGGGSGGTEVGWTPSTHDSYSILNVGTSDPKDVALYGHKHDDYVLKSDTRWEATSNGYANLYIKGIYKSVAVSGHKHSTSDITDFGNYVTINTVQDVTGKKWFTYNKDKIGTFFGPKNNVHLGIACNGGNSINGYTNSGGCGNIYFNITAWGENDVGGTYVKIDNNANLTISNLTGTPALNLQEGSRNWSVYQSGGDLGFKIPGNTWSGYFSGSNYGDFIIKRDIKANRNVIADGDVVARHDGGGNSDLPLASQGQYGLVKYDNTTIKKNSNGQLYAIEGDTWNGGTVTNGIYHESEYIQKNVPNGTGIRLRGNSIDSHLLRNSQGRHRIWLNYSRNTQVTASSTEAEVFIGNGNNNGTLIASINAEGNGRVLAKNGTGSLSDKRLKNILEKETNVLDKIENISAYKYTRKDDEYKLIREGLLAQDVASVFPTLAIRNFEINNEFYYTIDYPVLGAVIAVEGCKELKHLHDINDTRITNMCRFYTDKINTLTNEIELLKQEIELLKGGNK